MMKNTVFLMVITAVLGCSQHVSAHTILETQDFVEWNTAVAGQYNFTDFTQHADGELINEQYLDWGIDFVGGNQIWYTPWFEDGVGLQGFLDIEIMFNEPIYAIAIDLPSFAKMEVYFVDGFIDGIPLGSGSEGGAFGGIMTDVPIDRVVLEGVAGGTAFLDNLYVGHPIPAPSVLALFGLFAAFKNRRRRR